MSELVRETCEVCQVGAPPVLPEEREELLAGLPGWSVVEEEGMPRLRRVFPFPTFARALDFTVAVGRMADEIDHHPALLTEWGRVTVTWWTHKIANLHRNDFRAAARTDALLESLAADGEA